MPTTRKNLDGSVELSPALVSLPHSNRAKVEPTLPQTRIAKLQAIAAAAGSAFSESRANFLRRAGVPDSEVDGIASRRPSVPVMLDPEVAFANVLAAAEAARLA